MVGSDDVKTHGGTLRWTQRLNGQFANLQYYLLVRISTKNYGGAKKIIEGRKDHKNVSHVVSALHAIFGGCRHTTTYDYITSS